MNTKSAFDVITSRGITENDLRDMEAYIRYTHPHLSAGRMPFENYLMFWNDAKEKGDLFNLFGKGNLIIRKSVSFAQSFDEAQRGLSFYDFREKFRPLNISMREILREVFHRYGVDSDDIYFLSDIFPNFSTYRARDICQEYEGLLDLLQVMNVLGNSISDWEMWYNNELDVYRYQGENRISFQLPGHTRKYTITQDQKPIRALTSLYNYFMSAAGDDGFFAMMLDNFKNNVEAMRQYASMLTNQKYTKGTLCLSIHPFDYMTMSDEENGWTSCMKWCENYEDGGEYHSGTLEMMTSSSVVVAYLESKDEINPMGLSTVTWNKKNWRELFVIDKNFISGIKGYPYCSKSLEKQVFKMIDELMRANWGMSVNFDIEDDTFDDSIFSFFGGERHYLRTKFMYNDTDCNIFHALPTSAWDDKSVPRDFYYGEGVHCICCGLLRDYDTEGYRQHRLDCIECSDEVKCPRCDEWHPRHEMVMGPDGEWYCERCMENIPNCPECGGFMPGEYWDVALEVHYNTCWGDRTFYRTAYMCADCYHKYVEKGYVVDHELVMIDDYVLDKIVKGEMCLAPDYADQWIYAKWCGKGPAPAIFREREGA